MCWDRFLSRWRRRVASRSGRRWRCSRCRTAERDGRTFAVLPAKVFCSTLPSLVVVFFRFHFRVPCFCVFLVEPIAEFLSLSTNSSLFVLFFANPAHRRPPFLPSRRAGEQRVTGFFFVVFFYRIGLYVVNEITSRSYNSVLPSYRASNKKATRNRRRRHDGSVKTRK